MHDAVPYLVPELDGVPGIGCGKAISSPTPSHCFPMPRLSEDWFDVREAAQHRTPPRHFMVDHHITKRLLMFGPRLNALIKQREHHVPQPTGQEHIEA